MPKSEKKQIGPRIVRAWFDTVINPLINGVELEQYFLARGDVSWRYRPSYLEYIRPVAAHLDSDGQVNAEQFSSLYPNVGKQAKNHDTAVSDLADACSQLQNVLRDSNRLLDIYKRTTAHDSLKDLNVTLSELFGGYTEQDHMNLLAQYIINNTQKLSSLHTTASFWERFKGEFFGVLEDRSVRKQYEGLLRKADALSHQISTFLVVLKDTRMKLSLEHDVPYVVPSKVPPTQEQF